MSTVVCPTKFGACNKIGGSTGGRSLGHLQDVLSSSTRATQTSSALTPGKTTATPEFLLQPRLVQDDVVV